MHLIPPYLYILILIPFAFLPVFLQFHVVDNKSSAPSPTLHPTCCMLIPQIDCSHGNSSKQHQKQIEVGHDIVSFLALMLWPPECAFSLFSSFTTLPYYCYFVQHCQTFWGFSEYRLPASSLSGLMRICHPPLPPLSPPPPFLRSKSLKFSSTFPSQNQTH